MAEDVEGRDYVVCRECGHRGAKLYRHVESHGLSAREYRAKHGVDAPLRCDASVAKQDTARTARLSAKPKEWQETKTIACSTCREPHTVAKHMGSLHDLRCPRCKAVGLATTADSLWSGKTEGVDFVVCRDCGHRTENLTSHITNTHPDYRLRHPEAPIVASASAVRDKTALQGRVLSAETRDLMSKNAGRWNAGLTKETDTRVAAQAEKMRGKVSWNVGLTTADPRIAAAVQKLRAYVGAHRKWHNGLRADLTPEDFEPYLDERGFVDRHAAEEGLRLSTPTILSYMHDIGLKTSDKYVQARAAAQVIRVEKDDLTRFALMNGKVSIGAAMSGLGRSFYVITRECARHDLPTFHRRIRQTLCLEAVAKALHGEPFVQEWKTWKFANHKTGHRFLFDGYYEGRNLIVEFHGHQHYQFPNAYMLDESYRPLWEEMQWRDAEKVRLATAAGLRYLVVREDEPFTDVMYLAGRLVEMGVLDPMEVPLAPAPA